MSIDSKVTPDVKSIELPTSKDKKNKKLKPVKGNLILCTKDCRYNVIKRVCRRFEYKLDPDENSDWDVYWSDVPVQPEQISKV